MAEGPTVRRRQASTSNGHASASTGDAVRSDGKAVKQPMEKAELERKIKAFERTAFVRKLVLGIGMIAVVVFGARTFGKLLPKSSDTSAASPLRSSIRQEGKKFGTLDTSHLPNAGVSSGRLKLPEDAEKRDAVREAFAWSWSAYEKHGWGCDEYHPLSQGGSNLTSAGGVGYTIVDSIDSLLIMGFTEEYERARDWVQDHLTFDDKDADYNTFETTIRILGGLLSAYHLAPETDKPLFLDRAVDLGDRLLGAFDSPSGIPWSMINLAERRGVPDAGNNGLASLSEAGSLQLELKYLSYLTGDNIYWKKAERVTEVIRLQAHHDGIAPIFISPQNGGFVRSEIRLGSRGDSYYEYLLKQYLQTNRQEPVYRTMYDDAMTGIKKHMVGQTKRSGLVFTQELHPSVHPRDKSQTWQVVPKQDHLVCFLGGSFLLGVTEGGRREVDWSNLSAQDHEDAVVGKGIIESCMATHDTATGLAPEIAMFVQWSDEQRADKQDWYIKPSQGGVLIDARNILRPETVESLMLAYRITGEQLYRDWGWQVFQAFQKHCRVAKGGYASVQDVQKVPAKQEDRMETFWLGETLKYLYLLFDDSDHVPLDENIFNTEAHVLPVFDPPYLTPFAVS